MDRNTQKTFAVAIYGFIAVFLAVCAGAGVYGVWTSGAPQLVLIAGFFAMGSACSAVACVYASTVRS